MSRITKQKYVFKEIESQLPNPTDTNYIVKVIGNRGNYLYEVVNPKGEAFLVSMPVKFRKIAYICRGGFVMVENIEEGKKVKGEITNILMPEDVKYIHSNGQWPKEFLNNPYIKDNNITKSDEMIPASLLPPDSDDEESFEMDNESDESQEASSECEECDFIQID